MTLRFPAASTAANQLIQLKEEEEPMDTFSVIHTKHYKTPIEANLPRGQQEGLAVYADLDKRVIDALGI